MLQSFSTNSASRQGVFYRPGIVGRQMAFAEESRVKFTPGRLAVLSAIDAKRLEGRVGVVQGYRSYSRKPTVYFPQEGSHPEIRLFEVDPRQLEMVAPPPISPYGQVAKDVAEAGDSKKLSQSETDDLFN